MGEERRHAADGADFAFDIVERNVALGRRIELQDLRDGEPVLEFLPDVGAQPVAAAQAKPMLFFARLFRRIDQIAAQLADILEQRAVPIDDVVPEFAAENLSRITTEPPRTSIAPVATTPPTL